MKPILTKRPFSQQEKTYFFCSRIRMSVLIRHLKQDPTTQYRVIQYSSFKKELPENIYEQSKSLKIPLSNTGDRIDKRPCCLISNYDPKDLQKYLDSIFKSSEYQNYEKNLSEDMLASYNKNFAQDKGCIPVNNL